MATVALKFLFGAKRLSKLVNFFLSCFLCSVLYDFLMQ